MLADPKVHSLSTGGGGGFDMGTEDTKKAGANVTTTYTESLSGAWPYAAGNNIPNFRFSSIDQHGYDVDHTEGYFDPFQFHVSGELVAQAYPENNLLYNDHPVQFEIANRTNPEIRNMLLDGDNRQSLLRTDNPYTKKRVKAVEYLTRAEAAFDPLAEGVNNTNFASIIYGSDNHSVGHHLGSISTVNPDGRRYVFGQPVYNLYQRDATFSVNHSYNVTSNPNYQGPYATMTDYTAADNSLDNKKGQGHIYHGTVLPPYTHSYLLTAVLSSDYVDVDDNGPSQEDFGTWISLDYRQPFTASNPFYWRAPYTADNASGNNTANTASLNQGHFSNPDDDMASYTFGAREVFYLDKVESKTHMAVFHTSAREDGLPLQDDPINNAANGPVDATKKLEKLDRIELYKKATAPGGQDELIKTVHFSYSYDLCGNVSNNSGTPSGE
ncbi:MAG: hypothetical protein AAGB22_12610, partial [Bacteroidota bacterium]